MSIFTFQDGSTEIKKNNIIFSEGQSAQSINILLQGEVDVYISPFEKYNGMNEEDILKKSFRIYTIDQNMFIGSGDIFSLNNYTYSYQASKDCMVYIFCAQTLEEINALLLSHQDYGAYIMTSICSSINLTYNALERINTLISELSNFNTNLVLYFWHLKDKHKFECNPSSEVFISGLNELQKAEEKTALFNGSLENFLFDQKCPDISKTDNSYINELPENTLEYYKHFVNIPMEIRKSFYASDNYITITQCNDASKFLNIVQDFLRSSLKVVTEKLFTLYSKSNECIFSEYLRATSELKLGNPDTYEVFQALDFILSKIQELSKSLLENYKFIWIDDTEAISRNVDCIKAGSKALPLNENLYFDSIDSNAIIVKENQSNIPEELYCSASKIIEYSGISKEKAQLFSNNIEVFINLKDKSSTDEVLSAIRKELTSQFFEIYEAVFKKVIQEKNQSRLLHMFLTFGYMDERLLEPEQTVALYNMIDRFTSNGNDSIYSMRDWLSTIYNMQKDPSMNEFSQDYSDIFREMKKRHEVNDKDWPQYNSNRDARLNFEVNNMFKVNHRACCGRIGSYFPILHSGMITRDISKALITPDLIKEAISKLLEVDFTLFHREISYQNPEKGIEKELIMKSIIPDIILMPTFGSRASMWQEIAGRNRSTPGRFIIPILTDEDLSDMIIKLTGNYRWELCRTMMGVYWNDITQKSLTSEYTDYIQFYKKNRDLPEDVKGKITTQILRSRSMMRDIFTSDYEQWINYESKGIIRLNKVSRSILFKYCPFPKQTREQLSKHPMFSDLEARFKIMSAKQVKDLKNHYSKLLKSGITPDIEMEENLTFYMDM